METDNQRVDLINEARSTGDTLLLVNSLLSLAKSEKQLNHIKPAIQSYLEAIAILEKSESPELYNDAITELAEIYLDQQFLNEAQDFLVKSSTYYEEMTDTSKLSNAVFLLARVYLKKDLLDKAELQFAKFQELNSNPEDTIMLIKSSLLEGFLLEKKFQYNEAINSLYKAYALSKQSRDPKLYSLTTMELGRIHLIIGEANKAILALSRAEAFNRESRDFEKLKHIYLHLARAYELDDNYKSAYLYLNKYSSLNDSLLNDRRQEIINRLNIRYEAQQKQMEIINLANEKRLSELKARNDDISLYSMLIGFVGVLIAAYFTILYYQQRLRANQIITDQKEKINKSQINELKNKVEMESMQSMLQGQEMERDRVAKDLHDSLGGLLSSIKLKYDSFKHQYLNGTKNQDAEQIKQMLDLAIHEVRDIASNLTPGSLQKLGLVKAIDDLIGKVSNDMGPIVDFQHYNMSDVQLDEYASVHCYRIIQELLNNSIKHSRANEILVQISKQDDHISILVEDDGIGFEPESIKKGMGTDNILSRVTMLNGELNVVTGPSKGTSTMIEIPISNLVLRENT